MKNQYKPSAALLPARYESYLATIKTGLSIPGKSEIGGEAKVVDKKHALEAIKVLAEESPEIISQIVAEGVINREKRLKSLKTAENKPDEGQDESIVRPA